MSCRWKFFVNKATRARHARTFAPLAEAVESRVAPSSGLTGHPALEARQHRIEQHAERQWARHERQAAFNAYHSGDPHSLDSRVHFAVQTVQTGKQIAGSGAVQSTGLDFAKLGVAHDTRKLGWNYLSAAFRGDGNDIKRLNHSPLVHKVGSDFQALSHSDTVRQAGNTFSAFGKAVARAYHKVF